MAPKSNELFLSRIYDAPVKLVWDAWTDPKKAALWWGPRGFTLTTHSKDLRPGGTWVYTMHGPDGTDWPNITVYHEVEKYKKLVYDHGGNESQPPLFRVTVTFTEVKGKTQMDMTMAFESPEKAKEIAKFIKQAGGNSTWDRLAEYLDKEATGRETFFINRSFNAPIDVVFRMWSDPDHFSKWLAPTGFTMQFFKADIKPGGGTFYSMTNGEMKMFGKANYLEIEAPHRMKYTQSFCDENGAPSRHPGAPDFPETTLTTVTFTEEGPNQTRITVEWQPFNASPKDIETFVNMRSGMTMGWTGSFDKLEEYLGKL